MRPVHSLVLLLTIPPLFAGCGAGDVGRTELRSAILLEDGRTVIVSFSHWPPSDSPNSDAPDELHRAILARIDIESKEMRVLQVVEAIPGGERDSFQMQHTRGDYVLLSAPAADRSAAGYALLDARTGVLDGFDVEEGVHTEHVAGISTVRLASPRGWHFVSVSKYSASCLKVGCGTIDTYEYWTRTPHGRWVRAGAGENRAEWDDEELYIEDNEDPESELAYRPADGRRRRVPHAESRETGEYSANRDRTVTVRLDLSTPDRRPYLALRERQSDEIIERRIDVDLGPLVR